MPVTRAADPLPAPSSLHAPSAGSSHAGPAGDLAEGSTPWTARATHAVQLALAALFVVVGAVTLGGAADAVAPFGTIENVTGLGDGLRVTTGLLQIVGGLLLCLRASAGVGAVLLGVVMAGAAATDVLVLGQAPVAPAVLLTGLTAVAYAHRAALRVVGAVLERNL
jgi:hypothetical protein